MTALLIWIAVIAVVLAFLQSDKRQRYKAATRREPRAPTPKANDRGRAEKNAPTPRGSRYRDKPRLLNYSEQQLYKRLCEAVPAMTVFAEVSMSQVLHIDDRTPDRYRQLDEIGKKSLDFLICRYADSSIICAIELNGPTHDQENRKRSDETKRLALEEAGIPLIIFYPEELPAVADIRLQIAHAIRARRTHEEQRDSRMQNRSP